MKPCAWLILIPLFLSAGDASAQGAKKLGEAVKVDEVRIKGVATPGREVIAVISFTIDEGYHTHSSRPSEPNFIATALSIAATKGVTAGNPVYPKGKTQKVEGLDKPLSLYEGQFTVSVPLKLEAGISLPLTVPATLRYQACQGAQCYPPKSLKVDLTIPGASPAPAK